MITNRSTTTTEHTIITYQHQTQPKNHTHDTRGSRCPRKHVYYSSRVSSSHHPNVNAVVSDDEIGRSSGGLHEEGLVPVNVVHCPFLSCWARLVLYWIIDSKMRWWISRFGFASVQPLRSVAFIEVTAPSIVKTRTDIINCVVSPQNSRQTRTNKKKAGKEYFHTYRLF